jgi:hypothetical protein
MLAREVEEVIDLWIETSGTGTDEFLAFAHQRAKELGLPEKLQFKDMTVEQAALEKQILLEWRERNQT